MSRDEIINRWVEALRSGKYKQAKGRFREDDRHCCLAVLSEVEDIPTEDDGYPSEDIEDILGRPFGEFIRVNDAPGNTFEDVAKFLEEIRDHG